MLPYSLTFSWISNKRTLRCVNLNLVIFCTIKYSILFFVRGSTIGSIIKGIFLQKQAPRKKLFNHDSDVDLVPTGWASHFNSFIIHEFCSPNILWIRAMTYRSFHILWTQYGGLHMASTQQNNALWSKSFRNGLKSEFQALKITIKERP